MDIRGLLERLIGRDEAPARQAGRQAARGAAPQRAKPMMQSKARLAPAQRDFPGRTNYGVPQDNMIDTPSGYITPEQYNKMRTSSFRMFEDNSFQGNPRPFQAMNPGYNFYEDNSFSRPQQIQQAQGLPQASRQPMQGSREDLLRQYLNY